MSSIDDRIGSTWGPLLDLFDPDQSLESRKLLRNVIGNMADPNDPLNRLYVARAMSIPVPGAVTSRMAIVMGIFAITVSVVAQSVILSRTTSFTITSPVVVVYLAIGGAGLVTILLGAVSYYRRVDSLGHIRRIIAR